MFYGKRVYTLQPTRHILYNLGPQLEGLKELVFA